MSRAVIIGGSVAGLASALTLTELGYQVEILERAAAAPPQTVEDAARDWSRPTVPQAVHSHAFSSLGVNLLYRRAPQIYAALVAAGAVEIDLGAAKPPMLTDRSGRPEDEELRMLGCRRSTFELVLRREVLKLAGVSVRTGATVRGLELAPGAPPRITGVRLAGGEVVQADIVVDCSGRRSASGKWLAEAGVPVAADEAESCDITYYTRYYQMLTDVPPGPLNRGFGAGGLWNHYTAVLFLGDAGTFSISIGVLPEDAPMKALRHEPAFTAALRATPLLAGWVAPGASEPISPVYAMGGLDNCIRGVATTRQTPVLGLFHVGDAAGTTNPSYGRGVSLALAHAYELADTLRQHPEVSLEQATEMARRTERLLLPWYAEARQNDNGRARLWRATLAGIVPPQPPDGMVTFGTAVEAAATDAFVWRRLVRVMMSLAGPATLYADDEVRQHIAAARASGGGFQIPGPDREELVATVADATRGPFPVRTDGAGDAGPQIEDAADPRTVPHARAS